MLPYKIYAILTAIDIPIYLKNSSGVFVTGNKAFHNAVKLDYNLIINGITEENMPELNKKKRLPLTILRIFYCLPEKNILTKIKKDLL